MTTENEAKGGVLAELGRTLVNFFGSGKLEPAMQLKIETIFMLLGQVARADGVVSAQEASFSEKLIDELGLSIAGRRLAVEQFNRGREGKLDIAEELKRFTTAFPTGSVDARQLFDAVIKLAMVDGKIRPGEKVALEQITAALGFPLDALASNLAALQIKQ